MNASSKVVEQRWGRRIAFDLPMKLETAAGVGVDVWLVNGSFTGAFVETGARLALSSQVALRPREIAGEWLHARIVRLDDTGIALEWLNPGLDAVSSLLAWPRRHDGEEDIA